MNSDQEMFLVRKYAAAYLRVTRLSGEFSQVEKLQVASLFFQRYGTLLWHQSRVCMSKLLEGFHLKGDCFDALLALLERHRRLALFPRVFCLFVRLFKKKHGIAFVRIGYGKLPGVDLLDRYGKAMERLFFERVLYMSYEKPSLIAGVEIATDEAYWEYSVRRYLRLYARGVIGSN